MIKQQFNILHLHLFKWMTDHKIYRRNLQKMTSFKNRKEKKKLNEIKKLIFTFKAQKNI